ncbi:hypothetical protein ACT6NV_03420 [Robiginitalea sp. IMCC44478]|uniref:hypothetical protein n=1 Tax=Robiginitalea sp. IMCC44478 TaxID=3459122 RepID=UPI0040426182
MLYIISGASRSGKTLIAKKLLAKKGFTYLSLDWLVMGFTNGIPQYGIHDKLMPDEIAKRAWPFLKAMMESMIYVGTDCVIEGEALLPELMVELRDRYPDELKMCFLGYTEIAIAKKVRELKSYKPKGNDWLLEKPDHYITDHVQNMIGFSNQIKKSCREHSIPYIDTSLDFNKAVDDTVLYLLG